MSQLDLYSKEWCEIVFEDRFKDYGACDLREKSSKRHRNAIIITLVFFLLAFTLPGLIKSMIPEKKEQNVEVTALTDIDVEKNKKKDINEPIVEKEVQKIKSTIRFTPPVIKDDAEVKDEDLMKTQDEVNQSNLSVSTADVIGNSTDIDAQDLADLQNSQSQVDDGNYVKPYTIVEQMPEFPGGEAALNNYLRQNMSYPAIAKESNIQGTVFISFVVNRNGAISDVKILRGIGGGCDEEAVRVVRSMPAWIPGKQNGATVPVLYNLPVKFILN